MNTLAQDLNKDFEAKKAIFIEKRNALTARIKSVINDLVCDDVKVEINEDVGFGDYYSLIISLNNKVVFWTSQPCYLQVRIGKTKIESDVNLGTGGHNEVTNMELLNCIFEFTQASKALIVDFEKNHEIYCNLVTEIMKAKNELV